MLLKWKLLIIAVLINTVLDWSNAESIIAGVYSTNNICSCMSKIFPCEFNANRMRMNWTCVSSMMVLTLNDRTGETDVEHLNICQRDSDKII